MATAKTTAQKQISQMPDYFEEIPIDEMMEIVAENGGMVVDEAGEEWSGIHLKSYS